LSPCDQRRWDGGTAAQLFEHFGDCGFVGDASEGAATEHLLDGVQGGVVEALTEGKMQGATIDRYVDGNGVGGFEQGNREQILTAERGGSRVEGINRAAPLVGEGDGNVAGDYGAHLA